MVFWILLWSKSHGEQFSQVKRPVSPRRPLKLKGKNIKTFLLQHRNRTINIRIRIETFKMPFFLLCEMDNAIQQLTFEFLKVTINQKL